MMTGVYEYEKVYDNMGRRINIKYGKWNDSLCLGSRKSIKKFEVVNYEHELKNVEE